MRADHNFYLGRLYPMQDPVARSAMTTTLVASLARRQIQVERTGRGL